MREIRTAAGREKRGPRRPQEPAKVERHDAQPSGKLGTVSRRSANRSSPPDDDRSRRHQPNQARSQPEPERVHAVSDGDHERQPRGDRGGNRLGKGHGRKAYLTRLRVHHRTSQAGYRRSLDSRRLASGIVSVENFVVRIDAMSFTRCAAGVLFVAIVSASALAAENWTRFRGPNGMGVSTATNLPVEFGPEKNVRWKTALPPGHSSPVFTDSRIFLTAHSPEKDAHKLFVIALDRKTGKLLWQHEVPRTSSGAARAGERAGLAKPGHRRHRRLFLLPGVRPHQLHGRWQGAMAHAPWPVQHVLRLRGVADSGGRDVDSRRRSGQRRLPAWPWTPGPASSGGRSAGRT